MKNKAIIPLFAISTALAILIIGSLVQKDISFSNNENRYLQQTPKVSIKTILNGDFEEDAESYLSDQILCRDFWMEMKSSIQRILGKKDINGVYIGKDGYYLEKTTEDSFAQEQFEKNISYLQDFQKNLSESFYVMIVPTPATILEDKLPDYASMYNAEKRFELLKETWGTNFVDVREALSLLDEPYYHTDHHWTTFGAQAAYQTWCTAIGQSTQDYSLSQVSDSFYGTMYSKVLLPDSVADSVYAPEDISILSMDCDGETYTSFYFEDRLKMKDHYEYFMGGNYAKATIETGAHTGRKLLLIKDSFANSFTPFLLNQYDEITLLDLRYYTKDVLSFVDEQTDVLVLYEMTNFAQDTNLVKLTIQ